MKGIQVGSSIQRKQEEPHTDQLDSQEAAWLYGKREDSLCFKETNSSGTHCALILCKPVTRKPVSFNDGSIKKEPTQQVHKIIREKGKNLANLAKMEKTAERKSYSSQL